MSNVIVGKADTDYVLYDDGATYYLNQLVKSATWSGDISTGVRKLELSITNTTDGRKETVPFKLGKMITFSNFNKEIFRGFIFSKNTDSTGAVNLVCYDANVYLSKNTETRKFQKMTATQIIKQLCDDFGIPYGNIAETEHVFPKLIFRDQSLWEIMITAITETSKITNKKYYIGNKDGKLELYLRTAQVTQYVIENGVNLLSASYSQSIEDLVTQVKVVGGGGNSTTTDDTTGNSTDTSATSTDTSSSSSDVQYIGVVPDGKGNEMIITNDSNNPYSPNYNATTNTSETSTGEIVVVKKNDELIKNYGIMQMSQYDTSLQTQEAVEKLADKLLKDNGKIDDEADVESFGIDTVVAGSSVYAIDTVTKLNGSFYVMTDSHTFENGSHQMQVKLSYTDDLPEMDYVDPEASSTKDTTINAGDNVKVIIAKKAAQYGIPTWIVSAIVQVESKFNPQANGDYQNGAFRSFGLLQLYTVAGQGKGYTKEQLYDPVTNLDIGLPPIAQAYRAGVKKGLKNWELLKYVAGHSGHPSYNGSWTGSGSSYYPTMLKNAYQDGDELANVDVNAPDSSTDKSKPFLTGLPTLATNGIKRTYKSDRAYQLAMANGCTITSGYRSPKHNAEVGGSKKSQHVQGTAYDFGGTTANLDKLCAALLKESGYRQIIWHNRDQKTGAYIGGHENHVHVGWFI